MKRILKIYPFVLLVLFQLQFCKAQTLSNPSEKLVIGIGSCSKESKDLQVLKHIENKNPNLFIWMGDNIYGDTYDMNELERKYQKLVNNEYFKSLKSKTPMLSVWDDHDYGWNDEGKNYPYKKESRDLFLKYWEVKNPFRLENKNGIYGVEYIPFKDKKLQIILLDTRYNRDDLVKFDKKMTSGKNDYIPSDDISKSFLGEKQWAWLEETLLQPADLRIIVSSIQFSHEYNGWESWTNLPKQQEKMLDLIRKTRAENLFFISGDVHWGELSKYKVDGNYPIYDLTSSGLTEKWPTIEPNQYRIGEGVRDPNFGIIEWDGGNEIVFKIFNNKNELRLQQTIDLQELKF